MDKVEKKCKNCKYFSSEKREEQKYQKGKCHLNPRQTVVIGEDVRFFYPIQVENDVCSSFEEKKEILND